MSVDLAALAAPADSRFGYLDGQRRPSQAALLAAYDRESAETLALYAPTIDVPYAEGARTTFDFYRSRHEHKGTLLFLHAGYWQSRDKSQFRFLAPPFLGEGIDVLMVNYPLCPAVRLAEIVDVVRRGIPVILDYLRKAGRGGRELVVAGHSAGGHLAVELASTDWAAFGVGSSPIAGIIPISGVYDLRPLVSTTLNDALRLTEAEAFACSPLHRLPSGLPPASFLVGALETPDFQLQTQAMHEAWIGKGGRSRLMTIAAADHFSVLRAFANGQAWSGVFDLHHEMRTRSDDAFDTAGRFRHD